MSCPLPGVGWGKEARVARAKAKRWLGVVAGVVLPSAGVAAAAAWDGLPAPPAAAARSEDLLLCQALPRPSKTQAALTDAIESFRKGDYEAAAKLFQQAQAGWGGLTPLQQDDLTKFVQANNTALQGRREAADQVRLAEQAEREGRPSVAGDLAQKALANQFLAPADRQTAQALSDKLRGKSAAAPDDAANQVRTKLRQSRQLLAQGNFDGAEQLAKEAERTNAKLGAGEDTPKKVLEEINRVHGDSKDLLTAARAACTRGDYDLAEKLATLSEKAEPAWAVHLWGDSPAKVMKDAQAARGGKPAEAVADARPAAKDKDSGETWRGFFGGKKEAETKAPKVETVKQVRETEAAPAGDAKMTVDLADLPKDPKALLQKGRDAYAAGRLDEATQIAQRAKTAPGASWGLFDFDTPDKLIGDVNKARARRDQEESAVLLAEGRKLLERGDLDGAKKSALRAQTLHGAYSVWELGDRPQKVLDEVEAARKKGKGSAVPPVPPLGSGVASADKPAEPTTPRRDPAGAPRAGDQARQLMAQARQMQRAGRLIEARSAVLEAQKLPAVYAPDEDRPEKALIDLAGAARRQIDTLVAQGDDEVKKGVTDPRAYAEADVRLAQAQTLARAFQLDAGLIDDKLAWVRKTRTQGAAVATNTMPSLPPPAVPSVPNPDVARVSVSDGGPQNQGRELLAKARLEIRAGNTSLARHLVEDVYRTPGYGLQADAEAMLRSIDTEEFEQRRRDTRRTFEAGESAFRRRDYAYSSSVLRSLDPKMLEPEQQARMRELMAVPEMRQGPAAGMAVAQGPAPTTVAPGVPLPAAAGKVPGAETSPETSYLEQVQAMREVKFKKLREQGLEVQSEATKRFQAGETDRALEVLQEYLSVLPDTGLDGERTNLLRRPVESRLNQYKTLKAQKDFDSARTQARDGGHKAHGQKVLAEQNKQKRVQELMGQYNKLVVEAKWTEAEGLAMQALDLDPDNAIIASAVHTAKMRTRVQRYQNIKDGNEAMALGQLNDAQDEGPFVNTLSPLAVNKERMAIANKRGDGSLRMGGARSDKAKEIERRLMETTRLNVIDTPLGKVLDDLATWQGINIVPDLPALEEKGISLSRPVTVKLEQVSLKSVLNVLLHQVNLTYVVEDGILNVTTKEHAQGKLQRTIYPVAELVIPVENGANVGPLNPLDRNYHQQMQSPATGGTTPYSGVGSMTTSGTSVGSPGSGFASGAGMANASWNKSGAAQTREDQLIQLITSAVQPQTWASMGGQGTIDYFPQTMSLVINQTADIQEQVADLLNTLRKLQDAEVSIEVRLISIAEGFFERIGMDFNLNLKTDKFTSAFEPQITSGQFKPAGFINDFSPKSFLAGLTPAGTFTSDLDIPIRSSSFGMAIPPFGGFPNIPGGNGGISLGLAFLSDIQVYLFMEAAQGDQRTNVMQAPKLTLFNGQTATISVVDQQFFVTNTAVFNNNGQVTFVPQNTPFTTGGVGLTLQAVISADRRIVRLNFGNFSLTNLASATVPLFPVPVVVTPSFEGGFQAQPVVFTQFLQQPAFNTINVSTTVAVPDGGTVLIGGLKRLSEGRNEFGPPVLSKVPYINRLFKNVGYGREVQNFMMMVTPRIIINEEEERIQADYVKPSATGAGE